MTPVRNWKRWMAVGCSHGTHACPDAIKAVLKFKANFKPHTVLHLGDFVDTEALRKGGSGGECKNEDIGDDFDAGMDFLRKLQPTTIFLGNHEWRAYDLVHHKNEMVARCALELVGQFDAIGAELKAEIVPYNVLTGWRSFGNMDAGHGVMFNEQAIRDHAEMRGRNTLIAHVHTPGIVRARVAGNPWGCCVGWMGRVESAHYALRRRATTRWWNAFAWGEYCDNETTINLCEKTVNSGWRLPL